MRSAGFDILCRYRKLQDNRPRPRGYGNHPSIHEPIMAMLAGENRELDSTGLTGMKFPGGKPQLVLRCDYCPYRKTFRPDPGNL
jgi:hypothetical protein